MRLLCLFVVFFAFCGLAFADTIHLKNGEKIENAKLTEITQTDVKYKVGQREVVYTISKSDVQKVVYNNGDEDVFAVVETPVPKQEVVQQEEEITADSIVKGKHLINFGYLNGLEISMVVKEAVYEPKESSWVVRYGPGLGVVLGEYLFIPLFFNAHFGFRKSYFEYFLNNRLGTNVTCGEDFFCFFYEPSIGIRYTNLSLSLGYNLIGSDYENSLAIRIGYRFATETKIKSKPETKSELEPKSKEEKESSRFFRPGIEFNYPVWRSSVEYFDNSFPYIALGAGLFFRIGPEFFYLTTGAYAQIDGLEKHETRDLGAFGINIATLPLMDIYWSRVFVEIPLLLSFGSGQIRFTFGTLLDFYAMSQLDIDVLDERVISINDSDLIDSRFNENPASDLYAVLGLDFDIVRHWGIGVKFLIYCTSFGEYNPLIEPHSFQTRVSTYFVF